MSARATLAEGCDAIAGRGCVPVLSSESLCGDIMRNGHDRWQNADRLKQVVDRARVLLVVREQRQLVRSMYKTMVLWGMPYSVNGLLRKRPWGSPARFDLDFIRFDALVEYYASLYGKDAVLVLPYELFKQAPLAFLGHISAHSGCPAEAQALQRDLPLKQVLNPGQSLSYLHLQRWINRLTLTRHRDYAGVFGNNHIDRIFRRIAWHRKNARETWLDPHLEHRFETRVDAHLKGQFGASNRRLQSFCPVSLASFAYEM